jgi:hypothetical protein
LALRLVSWHGGGTREKKTPHDAAYNSVADQLFQRAVHPLHRGSTSVVPEMARHAVAVEHWLTAAQFTDMFAISQAAPGPSKSHINPIPIMAAAGVLTQNPFK